MTRQGLRESVIEHLGARRLNRRQLRRLARLQSAPAAGSGRRTLLPLALLAGLLMLAVMLLLQQAGREVAWEIADEVALNHLKQRPLEVHAAAADALQAYFAELDFRLQADPPGNAGRADVLGGRYCSIRGLTAAQLRLRTAAGVTETLFQARYDPVLYGELPDIGKGQFPRLLQVRGLTVELWVDKGLLFALVRD